MTITPDQARKWRDDARPGPWYVHTDPDDPDGTFIYDDTGNMCIAVDPAGSDYREADLTLAAAAPAMAEQIAGMQWEYGIDRENLQCNHIDHPRGCRLTMWCQSLDSARDGVEIAQQSDPTARIVRRMVSKPEEIG